MRSDTSRRRREQYLQSTNLYRMTYCDVAIGDVEMTGQEAIRRNRDLEAEYTRGRSPASEMGDREMTYWNEEAKRAQAERMRETQKRRDEWKQSIPDLVDGGCS